MGAMNALIIESDRKTAAAVAKALATKGFSCATVSTGKDGVARTLLNRPDIVLSADSLPDISGRELVGRIREAGLSLPVILLCRDDNPKDKISGLNGGADDCLAKPFAMEELLARVYARLRRRKPSAPDERISFDDLTMDTAVRHVTRNGRPIDLTSLEYRLLEHLLQNAGRAVSVPQILKTVWDCDRMPGSKIVESKICILRRKLCAHGERDIILTIRGFGYTLR